ncbi:serine/threonine-protein kinase [Actinomadura macrotermitis]|uniref:non-specific serine/threonine protein kinase n=1 Tax=Actinomadura macrotermitis TaxID=2585200 RepID=A0A7K0BLU8_9ACTN|nr:serine/threonine-protein kinase [Actinomadura macrotermitis]MQY02046.1 Serine/threonine-protein kinase PknD [Actinomadura macrotermitis]
METPSAAGRYRIDRLLGSGAFATVWLGHDEELASPVAIKILAEHWAQHTDVRERFVQEARLLRRVDSHRLVQVFDIGELADGRPYFVMTYADQGTLEDLLAIAPLPPNEALRLAQEVCRGLQELHGQGIVHRDLKPSNVLIRTVAADEERVMISDLGIARSGDRLSSLTLPAGSPGYMAPEQAMIDGAPDHRADIYGLGALTYHLLTGEPPGETRRPPSLLQPAVTPPIDAVVLRALEPDRDRRWPTAAAFGQALARTTGRIDTDPLPVPRPVPPRRRRGRRPGRAALLTAAGMAAAALGGGGAVLAFDGDHAADARSTAIRPAGDPDTGIGDPNGRWLRTDRDIPPRYRRLIVRAGTWCRLRGLSPALIAAMLKAESGFDADLSDPGRDEYGIARWTPSVLVQWQPGGASVPEPRPADITPEVSIPALGRYLCYWGRGVRDVPGDPALNLAAVYRTSAAKVLQSRGVPAGYRAYADEVGRHLRDYRPR